MADVFSGQHFGNPERNGRVESEPVPGDETDEVYVRIDYLGVNDEDRLDFKLSVANVARDKETLGAMVQAVDSLYYELFALYKEEYGD